MKLIRRLLLGLFILIAAIYAATPLWLEGVINSQLPPQWHLRKIQTGYPGLTGTHIHELQLAIVLPEAEFDIHASDTTLSYRELITQVDIMSVDIYLPAENDHIVDRSPLDILSLPLVQLPGNYRKLGVDRLDLAIHSTSGRNRGEAALKRPVEIRFQNLKLVPQPNEEFKLSADIESSILPLGPGRLALHKTAEQIIADLTFPAKTSKPHWLEVRAKQNNAADGASTVVEVNFHTDMASDDMIGPIITEASGGRLTRINGQLSSRAVFTGIDEQKIQSLTLSSDDLQLMVDGASINLNADLRATRDGQTAVVELLKPTAIRSSDTNGRLQEWLVQQFPELRLGLQTDTDIDLLLNANGRLVIGTDNPPSISYRGSGRLALENTQESLSVGTNDFDADMRVFPDTDSLSVNGRFTIDWNRQADIGYLTPGLDVKAEAVSSSAEVTANGGELTSSGKATFSNAKLADPATRADQLDIEWTDFDVQTLSGAIAMLTRGFQSTANDTLLSGFELDSRLYMSQADRLEGEGMVIPRQGPNLPFLIAGSIGQNRWRIDIPATRIKSNQAGTLLAIAGIELPTSISINDGDIDISGEIRIADDITSRLRLDGNDVDVAIKETQADDLDFSITGLAGDTLSANGPVSIRTIALAGGISITGFEAMLTAQGADTGSLSKLGAQLFEGSFFMDELRWSDSGIEATLGQLFAIDLGKLLEFADIDGLAGDGKLDINLPIQQEAGGIAVRDGTFQSLGSGFLAYQKAGVSATNIGLQALENFQFTQLSGTINYLPDGQYVISILLQGSNPELYDGYPIKFRLNLNGSLPEVFESLFMTGDFEDAILKRIRKQ